MKNLSILLLMLVAGIFACSENKQDTPVDNQPDLVADSNNGDIQLPENFGAVVVSDSVGRGRHIAVNENGDMYVRLRRAKNDGGIVLLKDENGDGKADSDKYFVTSTGTDIRLYNGYLYYSHKDGIYRIKLENGELPENWTEETIATFPTQESGHVSKSFTFDNAGNMYVNFGSISNACQEEKRTKGSPGQDPCPELEVRAGVWRFSADKLNQTQENDGYRYATGIRNIVGLDWNDQDNTLYVTQHGRDQLSELWPDSFTDEQRRDLPAEEFLRVNDGDDFGWPYCFYDQFQKKRVTAPEYGGDGQQSERCEGTKDPLVAFPGHMAPNDLLFYTGDQFPDKYKNGAFIAFHGSWNRAPFDQAGFFVVFVPFNNGEPSQDWEVFADGFAGPTPVKQPRDAVARPCGLAQGPDGSLYVVDSQKGKVWRIFYKSA
ncbi:PQQ-dependent sugar dehydrogenase [Fulvivirgaceae bacterium BMA10]|uniref:PQQ-dependent sugar dehydrogenase n=1 Tax=Splendidivirga corallicola TaxID=3051826 RepID=A0ABT8KVS1_9BACT|nr:PQQ-dependent sugar dehydrogenase [Fulvivirgaceae bacterium BMA10]